MGWSFVQDPQNDFGVSCWFPWSPKVRFPCFLFVSCWFPVLLGVTFGVPTKGKAFLLLLLLPILRLSDSSKLWLETNPAGSQSKRGFHPKASGCDSPRRACGSGWPRGSGRWGMRRAVRPAETKPGLALRSGWKFVWFPEKKKNKKTFKRG